MAHLCGCKLTGDSDSNGCFARSFCLLISSREIFVGADTSQEMKELVQRLNLVLNFLDARIVHLSGLLTTAWLALL